jgi:hypothetical protein
MTKPEYTVNVTADSEDPSKAVYTLTKTDVPDPNQRYTIALDPALFTDGKFTVKLGDNGNLTEANSVVTSRVVATLKVAGKLALDLKLFDLSEKADLGNYQKFLRESRDPACTANVAPGGTVSSKIDAAIEALVKEGESAKKDTGVDAAISGYFYTSVGERKCLEAVRTTIESTTPAKVTDSQTQYNLATTALENTIKGMPNKQVATIVAAVHGWVQAKDATSIKKATLYTGKHHRDFPNLDDFMTAAQAYINDLLAFDRVKALAKAFDLKPDVWRARFVKSIGREIEALRLEKDLGQPSLSTTAGSVAELERRRADLVGGLTLFDRIKNIDEFLKKEIRTTKTKQDGSVRYAADEHIKLREERDKLDAQLKALIASTLSSDIKGGDKNKIKPRRNESVRLAGKTFVDDVNASLSPLFDKLPEFVLVLTRKEGENFSDKPVLKDTKEAQK